MSTLHTVNKSPFEKRSLEQCLVRLTENNAVLLIEDAVYAATQGTAYVTQITDTLKNYPVYVLGPDLDARGLANTALIEGIGRVDYEGFVELTTRYEKVQAWL